MYVGYLEGGLSVSKFLSIQALKADDAPGICDGFDAAFKHAGFSAVEWRDQLVGFGAAVMLGCSRAVAAVLKDDVLHMVNIYCVAHRLKLGIRDAVKDEKQLKDVKKTLQGLYKHYHYSSKALRELSEVAVTLEFTVLNTLRAMGHYSCPTKN